VKRPQVSGNTPGESAIDERLVLFLDLLGTSEAAVTENKNHQAAFFKATGKSDRLAKWEWLKRELMAA
jgi:hypothetical protein